VHRQFRKLTKTQGRLPERRQLAEITVFENPERKQEVDDADPELDVDPVAVVDLF
jgi:hypothetical protein